MASDVNNKIDVRNDGCVVIYQRQNRDGTINNIFQMRIRIPLPGSKGYYRASTKESDVNRATQVALNTYDELYNKVKSGGSLLGKSFKDLFNEWKDAYPKITNESRPEYIEWSVNRIGAYPLDFFTQVKKNPKVEMLSQRDFDEYYSYRRENSLRNGKPFVPSNNTLRKETTLLNQMMAFAFERGYINKELRIKRPAPDKESRRPAFSKSEWKQITEGMRRRVKEGYGAHLRDRITLQNYALILANSGIRIGEARNLTWRDVERRSAEDDEDRILLNVRGKTGSREVVCNKGTETYFMRLYDFRKLELNAHPAPNTPVFCHADGRPIQSMRKAFESLLTDLDLVHDSKGNRRTLYSLRHTYATFRLSEEVSPYLLARQMGTSVEMLEKHYGQVVNREVTAQITKTRSKHNLKVSDKVYPF